MRISDWSSDVCSSDLLYAEGKGVERDPAKARELALRSAGYGDVESYLWLLRASRPGGVLGADSGQSGLLAEKLMAMLQLRITERSEGRREGKECGRTCRYRGSPEHKQNKRKKKN